MSCQALGWADRKADYWLALKAQDDTIRELIDALLTEFPGRRHTGKPLNS